MLMRDKGQMMILLHCPHKKQQQQQQRTQQK